MAQAQPAQQKVKDTIVLQALRFLLSPEQAAQIEQSAKQDPVGAVVNSTIGALKQIKGAAESAGRGYAGDKTYMIPAAIEVASHLLEMLIAFKSIDQRQAQQIFSEIKNMIAQIMGGQQPSQPAPKQPAGLLAQGA